MKAALKWTAIVFAALIVVVVSALLITPKFIDVNRYKPELEKYVLEKTGRPLVVGGDIRLSLFPGAGVAFSDLRLGAPPAFAERDFLAVKSVDVRLKLWPLLSRQVEIDRLVVEEPRVFLVTNRDGRVSWDLAAQPPGAKADAAPETGPPALSLLVADLSIQNGQVIMINHRKGSRQEISGLNLTLRDLSMERPVRLSFSAALDQKPLSAEGRFGPVGKNLGEGAVPVELTADVFTLLKLKVKGTVENLIAAPLASLTLEVPEFSPRKLLAEIVQALPATADDRTLARASLKAGLRADASSLTISDAVMTLDDSTLNLSARASGFDKPTIGFDLSVDHLDLDRYLPPASKAGGGSPSAGAPAERSPQKTDYKALRQLVLSGNAKFGKLVVNNAHLEDADLKIAAKDGILALDPFSMKLYQGTAVGKTAVNLNGESPVTDVHINLEKVQVNPLLKDVAGKDFLEGTAKARVQLSMAGDDPVRIKQTLDGKGSLTVNDGAIVGVDLAGLVRNVKAALGGEVKTAAKPRTDFAELVVPFTFENGVFHTPDTSLKSPLLRLVASGEANLVQETLDFRVDPKVVGTIKGQGDEKQRTGIGVPLIVSGTFASPSFRPDVESLAKDRLKQRISPSETGSTSLQEKAGGVIKGLLPGKK
jgi:AsmA protein